MTLFDRMATMGHEQVSYWSDPAVGYRGIIAVHDTSLGPSLGGTRLWRYGSAEEALTDVLRLSRSMTYKAAAAGLELGGGKSVIIEDGRTRDREALFRAHGRAIESLGGRYYAAEDVGTSEEDMEVIRSETRYVTGLRSGSGEPSPLTAVGTYEGIRACMAEVFGEPSVEGRHVAVQGLGQVGRRLCDLLGEAGAKLTVTDVEPERIRRIVESHAARAVAPHEIYDVEADVFSPCALGSAITRDTLGRLKVVIVAGAANNQLATADLADELHRRGILYAPDYVINAGGVISVYGELRGWDPARSREKAEEIHDTLRSVFRRAREKGTTPAAAADAIAEARLNEARANGKKVRPDAASRKS
jgi:leucine dehydrogenase